MNHDRTPGRWLARLATTLTVTLGVHAQQREADFYGLQDYAPPAGEIVEVGGIGFVSPTQMVVSTRRGQVWWIDDALADDPRDARWTLFAEGLHEGLGLNVHDGTIYIVQRGELSTLHDFDGDRRCDEVRTANMGWGMSGNYHEFAFGLPRDAAGNLYVATNLGFFSPEWWLGVSRAPWRGWILRIAPDGSMQPFASGARSPCGLGMNLTGDLFYTDNQGDWMATCPIFHVTEGDYFGHPASLRWTEEYGNGARIPSGVEPASRPRKAAAIWLPYAWSRSAGNLVTDRSEGKFGPYAGQQFVAELTNGMVLRTQFEKVRGEYQGAAFLFRRRLGSVCRVAFAPDDSMIVGYTNRGWGGRAPGHGLARLRWTGATPFDMHSVALQQDGFEVRFTKPLADDTELTTDMVYAELYNYSYWWEYGSPVQQRTPLRVASVERGSTPEHLRLRLDGIEAARCAKIVIKGVRSTDGEELLHDTFHYTINQLPEGPRTELYVARQPAVQPTKRRGRDEGWLHLTWGDATALWRADGWKLVDAEIGVDDRTQLAIRDGNGALVRTGGADGALVSEVELGDFEFRFRFMLPEGGAGEARFMDRYVLELVDDPARLCGIRGEQQPDPDVEAYQGPGEWHVVQGRFFAPRFDAAGDKVSDARFESIQLEGVNITMRAAPHAPSDDPKQREVARAPLVFRSAENALCLADIRVRALDDATLTNGDFATTSAAVDLFADGAALGSWQPDSGDAEWTWSDGVLRASNGAGRIATRAADFTAFELRSRLAVDAEGEAGIRFCWDGTTGYEAAIESRPSAQAKTGSLVGIRELHTDLIPAGIVCDYVIRCTPADGGQRSIQIAVNGVKVVDVLEPADRHPTGGRLAIEITEGTQLRVESMRVTRL